eukprot:IDg21024t1
MPRDVKFDENDVSAVSINVESLEIYTSKAKEVISPRQPASESELSTDNNDEKDGLSMNVRKHPLLALCILSAPLLLQGHQVHGADYTETFAPV